jgi:hypothetical protein
MTNLIPDTIALKLSALYRLILKYIVPPPGKKEIEFTNEYDLVIVCRAHEVEKLKQCLKSIYYHFQKLPHIFVFTDLNVDVDECRRAVKWFPVSNLNIIRGSDCLNYHLKHQEESLLAFIKAGRTGLKMAAVMQMLNAGKPIIYCDTDVLWYQDPLPAVQQYLAGEGFELAMLEGSRPAYDQPLVQRAELLAIWQPPFFYAGILLVKKLSDKSHNTLESLLAIANVQPGPDSEQTILASVNKKGNDLPLDKHQFILDDAAQNKTKAGPELIARQYSGKARGLFWRDALGIKR